MTFADAQRIFHAQTHTNAHTKWVPCFIALDQNELTFADAQRIFARARTRAREILFCFF